MKIYFSSITNAHKQQIKIRTLSRTSTSTSVKLKPAWLTPDQTGSNFSPLILSIPHFLNGQMNRWVIELVLKT